MMNGFGFPRPPRFFQRAFYFISMISSFFDYTLKTKLSQQSTLTVVVSGNLDGKLDGNLDGNLNGNLNGHLAGNQDGNLNGTRLGT